MSETPHWRDTWYRMRTTVCPPEPIDMPAATRNELALTSSNVGTWVLDMATGQTWYSPRVWALLGHEAGWMGPPPLLELVEPSMRDEVLIALEHKLNGLWPLDLKVQLKTATGERRWFRLSAEINPGPGDTIAHLVGSLEDISVREQLADELNTANGRLRQEMAERESAEAELRLAHKLEAVGQLAAGLAHEINTPIQYVGDSVSFLTDALDDIRRVLDKSFDLLHAAGDVEPLGDATQALREAVDEADLEYLLGEMGPALSRASDGTRRVATIVRAMKQFARPDEKEMRPSDLNAAIESTLIVARHQYKHIAEVRTQLEPLPLVPCHLGDINQVFLSLIVNAAHAIEETTSDGELGSIEIATRMRDDMVEVRISDNGCGIPSSVAERVWEPFFTTKDVGRGSGQGLSLARTLVDRHQGTLHFEPRTPSGTVFVLRLPLSRSRPSSSAA